MSEPQFLEKHHHNHEDHELSSSVKKVKTELEEVIDNNIFREENQREFKYMTEEEYREERDVEQFLENEGLYSNDDDMSLRSDDNFHDQQQPEQIVNADDNVLLSYQNEVFDSEEMKLMIELQKPQEHISGENLTANYNNKIVFPDWLLHDPDWKRAKGESNKNNISEILQLLPHSRNADQVEILVYWLQSVWPIAKGLTYARCAAMLKEFKYFTYETGVNIITENERGLTFYIIVSGETEVIKDGIGVVAQLGKGKSFGEIALTQGKDLRTATVRTLMKVETLSLHKSDYDHFIRDIQMAEKRENYFLLKDCKLFSSWARTKIDRLSNLCQRKMYEPGSAVFKQGDPPDNLYILMDGTVEIIKELKIICKNRWPTGMNSWSGIARKKNQPFTIQVLSNKGDYFGELSIIRNSKRTATAIAATKCSIVLIDRLEFLHLLRTTHNQNTIAKAERSAEDFISDQHLLESLGSIKGGPTSVAIAGSLTIYPNDPKSRSVSPKRKKKIEKRDEDDENYFKKASQQAGAEKNMSKLQSGLTEALKEAKDKVVDDRLYFTETNTTASGGKHKALGFERKSRMTLPSLTTTFSESKIVFEPVERNLNEYAKYRFHPKPGETFLPLSATVVQLDTLESNGRRVRSNSVTNLKKIREKMGSPDRNQTTRNIYDNEETDDFIPEIINDRKKKHDSSDLSLLRKKKLSYRDVMGDL
jgi:CRP-like cAMP-binding protein